MSKDPTGSWMAWGAGVLGKGVELSSPEVVVGESLETRAHSDVV